MFISNKSFKLSFIAVSILSLNAAQTLDPTESQEFGTMCIHSGTMPTRVVNFNNVDGFKTLSFSNIINISNYTDGLLQGVMYKHIKSTKEPRIIPSAQELENRIRHGKLQRQNGVANIRVHFNKEEKLQDLVKESIMTRRAKMFPDN